jgi:thiosulfate reductase cytochrome b subunit
MPLRREPQADTDFTEYNVLQRLAYSIVVLALLPLMVWTGLAMSPAVTSVWPWLVDAAGGFQSARTLHFAAALAVVLFATGHILMVLVSGWRARVRSMITGRRGAAATPGPRPGTRPA